ncbi:MAG: sulfatase [candidate division KSB1 bacterium]|nr:sulfatase [candidate division KSB1 bacterium]
MVNRREFIRKTAMGLTMFGLFSTVQSRTVNQPNVLFIICDDLNDSLEKLGGHPQAVTPNLKSLMDKSVQFNNAHSNDPICGPSRASFLTGIYPHTSGYFGYQQQQNHWRDNAVLKNARTFMEHFGAHGYKVYGTGKIFHNDHEDWGVWKNGFGIKPTFGPVAWDGGFWDGREERGTHDHDMGLALPSVTENCPEVQRKLRWYNSFGSLADVPEYFPDPEHSVPGFKGWMCYGKPFRYVSETDRDLTPDEKNAEYAVDILNQNHREPFLLCVGMNRPHTPLHAPQEYFDMHPLEDVKLPPYLENDLADCAKALYDPSTTWTTDTGFKKFELLQTCDNWKRWVQAYLACVSFVDDQIGKILVALKKSACAHNTVVVVVSDHGYHMGEKNYTFKNTLWEESSRVPLIIHRPGMKDAGICTHPVSLIDLYPTLCDICKLPENPNETGNGIQLDGHSLVPFLENPNTADWNGPDVALTSVASNDRLEPDQPGEIDRQHYAVWSERYRYILCNNGEEELYDHKKDPHEWHNLADDQNYGKIKANLKNKLNIFLSSK